jgi:hypothetical protein
MSNTSTEMNLSIINLPHVLHNLFERAHRPLLPEAQGQVGLFVRYLRRKPERGLAVIYTVDELNSVRETRSNAAHRSVSLTIDEMALNGANIIFTMTQADEAALDVQASGVLRVNELGLSVQAFPADNGLPNLATSCDVSPSSPVFDALEKAARTRWNDSSWKLVHAQSAPVRYKPGNRCVIRYQLLLVHALDTEQDEEAATLRPLTIFGKVYADTQQASTVQQLQGQLYDEQNKSGERPFLPQPLGLIDAIGLTFNEAIQPINKPTQQADAWSALRTGTRALQPRVERRRGGEVVKSIIPTEELHLTGQALARLHTSAVQPNQKAPRTGAKEAKRARERATLIATHNPEQAEEVQHLVEQLANRLSALQPESYRPAHGGFKASQLLFHSHRVFVVDFDGFCLADPALDVGYFLAYLRPSGLWYASQGMRQWFEEAATLFRDTYRQTMLAHGVEAAILDSILGRSRLYEAALIFKIATRRANRLNSPRSQELAAMLQEIAGCLGNG